MKLHFGAVRLDNQVKTIPVETHHTRVQNGWERTELWELTPQASGSRIDGSVERKKTMVARAEQVPGAETDVRFLQGKGGLSAIITTNDLTYIALPGSKIKLPDTLVEMPGAEITGTPLTYLPASNTPKQKVTNQAMILGAGLATRFEPISGGATGFPKPGVPLIGNDSVIVAIAKLLKKHGINKILVNTFYMPDRIKEQLNRISGVKFMYIDESKPSGTAGGLAQALDKDMVDKNKPLLIMQGDAVTDVDLSFLLNTHAEKGAKVTIGAQQVPDANVSKVGIIVADKSGDDGVSGSITGFQEKPSLAEAKSRLGNTGIYVLSPQVYSSFKQQGKRLFAKNEIFDYALNFFPSLLKKEAGKKPMWAQALSGYWNDIGRADQYVAVVKDLYAGRANLKLPKNVRRFLDNGVIYWPGAKGKAKHAELRGNVIVAKTPVQKPE